MADDSWMDYIRTFLSKIHTTATVYHITEKGKQPIGDTEWIRVYPSELMSSNEHYHLLRFRITLHESTEPLLMAAVNNIAIGVSKLNRRETITDYTRPASFIHVELKDGNKVFSRNGWFNQDLNLDCKFTTS